MRSAARLILAVSAATLVAGCATGSPFGAGRGGSGGRLMRHRLRTLDPDA